MKIINIVIIFFVSVTLFSPVIHSIDKHQNTLCLSSQQDNKSGDNECRHQNNKTSVCFCHGFSVQAVISEMGIHLSISFEQVKIIYSWFNNLECWNLAVNIFHPPIL